MVNITIVGTGYVGFVSGTCLADFGNTVICVDTDKNKIENLKKGILPIFEPGLEEMIRRNEQSGRLSFSTCLAEALGRSSVVFIAAGTPSADDGSADLRSVEQAAREIGRIIDTCTTIVDKSTVPVGTGQKVKRWIQEELDKRDIQIPFDVVSNPEFLREGTAVYDFTHPDRIVVGTESEKARAVMKDVYRILYRNEIPYIETNLESAEMIKYASNAFLAVKISYINEIASLCEKTGADIQNVARAMGCDGRIGSKFLRPGPGYGGSCFPKDTRAITAIGRNYDSPLSIIEAAIAANERQKERMIEKIDAGLGGPGSLTGKIIGILGLAFKNNTNDMRESPAITLCTGLVRRGARLRLWDPAAMEEAVWRLSGIKDSLYFATDEYDAVQETNAVVILTEWNQFRSLDLRRIKSSLVSPYFFDLRNIYKREEVEKEGLNYFGVGR
jgi:UDPglucose 6-dehydrogenase